MARTTQSDNGTMTAAAVASGESLPRLVGEYLLTRDLGPRGRVAPSDELGFGRGAGTANSADEAVVAQRYLCLHEVTQTSHVAYRFAPCTSKAARARFEAAFESLKAFTNPHVLRLDAMHFQPGDEPWLFTPFCGDADGLRCLAKLLRQKGGQLSQIEAEQAITQILLALDSAHDALGKEPVYHGSLALDEVLVDRHGRVIIELYGFARRLRGISRGNSETVRDELLRVSEIAYQLLTGLRAEAPLIPATRLVPRLDKAWDQWLRFGLDPSRGFETAKQALDMLPAAVERMLVVVPSRARSIARV